MTRNVKELMFDTQAQESIVNGCQTNGCLHSAVLFVTYISWKLNTKTTVFTLVSAMLITPLGHTERQFILFLQCNQYIFRQHYDIANDKL